MEQQLVIQGFAPVPAQERLRWGKRVALSVAVWGLAVAGVSLAGGFVALPGRFFPPLLAVLATLLPTLAYLRIPGVRTWFDGIAQQRVVLFHTWRVAAAVAFWVYGAQRLLPALFVRNAAWGDLFVALLAVATVVFWPRRSGYLVFHAVGLADLLVAVGTAALFTARGDVAMANVVAFPLALIPLFGVGLSAASHLASFVQLLGKAKP